MTIDTDLPHQPDAFQQPSLEKKNSNNTWVIFSILLILINLLFFLAPLTFSLPLTVIDFIAVRSYVKKQSSPWKYFIISLLIINIIFFYFAELTFEQSAGAVAGFGIIPVAFALLLIDFIGIFSYIYIHLPNIRAKIIFYIALISILLGLLALSVFYSAHP